MSYVEEKYISLASSNLQKFTKRGNSYNFRCPYCGDSKKYTNKTRGYLYPIKDTFNYKCHNCGQSCSFSTFLKFVDSILYSQYIFDKFRPTDNQTLTPIRTNKPIKFNQKKLDLPTILDLDSSHYARYYLEERKIPKEKLKTLYYCQKFKEWTNTKKQTFNKFKYDEPRIIIPLIYQDKVFGFQGRSLKKSSNMKYITIILDDSIPKVYGMDDLDPSKNIYVLEGPIDSMFVPNSIAMAGADINISSIPNHQSVDFIFVYDNEPRNRQIIKRMEKTIDEGHSIVIWPTYMKQKDINCMVIDNIDPIEIIRDNTFCGLQAKVKLLGWKKV